MRITVSDLCGIWYGNIHFKELDQEGNPYDGYEAFTFQSSDYGGVRHPVG